MGETEKSSPEKVNLLDFDAEELKAFCAEMGEKPFRARKVDPPTGC